MFWHVMMKRCDRTYKLLVASPPSYETETDRSYYTGVKCSLLMKFKVCDCGSVQTFSYVEPQLLVSLMVVDYRLEVNDFCPVKD